MLDKTVARNLHPLFMFSHDEIGAGRADHAGRCSGQATLFDAALSTFLTMKHFM